MDYPKATVRSRGGASKTNRLTFAHSAQW